MLATERNQETTKKCTREFRFFFLLSKRRDRLPPKKDDRQLAIYNKAKEHLYTHNTPINFERGKKKKGKGAPQPREKKKNSSYNNRWGSYKRSTQKYVSLFLYGGRRQESVFRVSAILSVELQ